MTVLVTPDEMQAAEDSVIARGTPAHVLMLRAAESIAIWIDKHVCRRADVTPTAVAFVGPGNNGGDALVVLALLHERGWNSRAIFLNREQPGDLPASDDSLTVIERIGVRDIGLPDVILDGVFGFRSRATLPANVSDAFRIARGLRIMHSVPLVAIDVPSGIDAATGAASPDAFPADVTLCLGLPKVGLVRAPAAEFVGELELLSIGTPAPEMTGTRPRMITDDVVRPLLPHRTAFAHKYDGGTAVIVGGAPSYYGAPRLAAEAAARSGAGLVCAAVPKDIAAAIASQVPEVVLLPLDDSDGSASAKAVIEFLERRSSTAAALIAGPGLGRSERATALLDDLFDWMNLQRHTEHLRLTIDADALNWLGDHGGALHNVPQHRCVLTPHAGELARLLKRDRRDILNEPVQSAIDAAEKYRQIIVLKLGYTVVAEPGGSLWHAPRSTPELATAGTGDVLAGLIGGLMAQGMEPIHAALSGVFLGSQAGKRARQEQGTLGVVARDVINHIPGVLSAISDPRLIVTSVS